ncbi:uncharacterized protein LOC128726910 [Anopheles nili]|uniref:uncharacterized protein LOC128726910 n=1 Tax=Anopheles nili TaxID=185578 RepID=UPI00237BC660|nr:uncharacterized protein LOC128726910 [Anopheles nili]
MGSLHSKVSPSRENSLEKGNELFVDPRSPTLNINRSPIVQEVSWSNYASITKVKDLTATLTNPNTDSMQTPAHHLPKRFQSIIDPRSPSTFTRTPLIVDPEQEADCSLTNVVSSLQYEECSVLQEVDNVDASFKDCDPQMLDICNLQIEYDESEPIIQSLTDPKEVTIFEDAQVVPFAGIDPRSPNIAIARTPMMLVELNYDEHSQDHSGQVAVVLGFEENTKEKVEKLEQIPHQERVEDNRTQREDETPKKDKLTTAGYKSGNRTPLGCVTNIATPNNIRKMALIGQIKQSMAVDEQKLLSRSGNFGSAELNTSAKQTNRSRIPKLRLS